MGHILLCDDDEGIIDVTRMILEEKGHTVKVCKNGSLITKSAQDFKPNLILMDLFMPGPGAEEVIKSLRKNKSTSSTPIIVLSAIQGLERRAKELYVDGYLSKPFNIEELENIVNKHLQKPQVKNS